MIGKKIIVGLVLATLILSVPLAMNAQAGASESQVYRFTRRALTENYAFGHFIASYAIPDITSEVVEQAIEKTIGGVKYAMLDQKAQGSSEDRRKILDVFEKRGIEIIKLSK